MKFKSDIQRRQFFGNLQKQHAVKTGDDPTKYLNGRITYYGDGIKNYGTLRLQHERTNARDFLVRVGKPNGFYKGDYGNYQKLKSHDRIFMKDNMMSKEVKRSRTNQAQSVATQKMRLVEIVNELHSRGIKVGT